MGVATNLPTPYPAVAVVYIPPPLLATSSLAPGVPGTALEVTCRSSQLGQGVDPNTTCLVGTYWPYPNNSVELCHA